MEYIFFLKSGLCAKNYSSEIENSINTFKMKKIQWIGLKRVMK